MLITTSEQQTIYFTNLKGLVGFHKQSLEQLESVIESATSKKDYLSMRLPGGMFCLDFDAKPSHLSYTQFKNILEKDLKDSLPEDSFTVFTSPSGKVKAIIFTDCKVYKDVVEEFVTNTITDKYLEYLDLNKAAYKTCFIHDINIVIQVSKLKRVSIEHLISSKDKEFDEIEKTDFCYNIAYTGAIPERYLKLVGNRARGQWEKFLKVLLSLPQITTGFQLPVTVLANTLNTNTTTASRLLKRAVEFGILEMTEAKYIPGKEARTYKLIDEVLAAYMECLVTVKNDISKEEVDGNYNNLLMLNINKFSKYDELEAFLNPILNRERKLHLKNAWAWKKRKEKHTINIKSA